ncbi:hypothetical protein N7462_002415 [Penicillium macrosclerotiorum]|uniref:uncharacterized protein n=1 Tax=Penicillium macrosclerotiorum TaxID=303699 RepID=UPI002549928A|nr:uncharacterized protein N7462_002415 [Penicillium macrosclerotiorum]KAJ5692992.1 hypothetical protein N7462_002415 [Penicillium macrosclerotiorum]
MTPRLLSFQCQFPGCRLSYRRKEHLTRHAKKHLPPQSFKCPFCDRTFSRNDTLRQHARIHHKHEELQSSRAIRACTSCRSRRSKCSGQDPCDTCNQRGKKCVYSNHPTSRDHHAKPMSSLDEGSLSSLRQNSISSLPRSEIIENSPIRGLQYIEIYFDKFHPCWPFLHPATFDSNREPAFLLQSVIMMGMWVTGIKDNQDVAKLLHEKLSCSIYEQRDKWDISCQQTMLHQELLFAEPTSWPIATYQGILLHLIFSVLTQRELDLHLTQPLPEVPSQLLVTLVSNCLRRKMFFYPSILGQFKSELHPIVLIWLGIEEIKRFALSLYKVCQSARVYDTKLLEQRSPLNSAHQPPTKRTKLLSLADLQFALPDSDDLWNATSNLATSVAENSAAYEMANIEDNWISQATHLLQPQHMQFRWIC